MVTWLSKFAETLSFFLELLSFFIEFWVFFTLSFFQNVQIRSLHYSPKWYDWIKTYWAEERKILHKVSWLEFINNLLILLLHSVLIRIPYNSLKAASGKLKLWWRAKLLDFILFCRITGFWTMMIFSWAQLLLYIFWKQFYLR